MKQIERINKTFIKLNSINKFFGIKKEDIKKYSRFDAYQITNSDKLDYKLLFNLQNKINFNKKYFTFSEILELKEIHATIRESFRIKDN